MPRLITVVAAAVLPLLSGCATTPKKISAYPTVSYESVVRQMKWDIGTYVFRHKDDIPVVAAPGPDADATEKAAYAAAVRERRARPVGPGEACPSQLSFTISKVKVNITATAESKFARTGGLEVPIGAVTLSPAATASDTTGSSITTTLEIYPQGQEPRAPKPSPEFEGTPIADALERLAIDLRATADTPPCFDFGIDPAGAGNTLKWGFTVKRDSTLGGKLKLVFFSIGADVTNSFSAANTIEVTFMGVGGFG